MVNESPLSDWENAMIERLVQRLRPLALVALCLCAAVSAASAQEQTLLVFAAASLKNALDEVDAAFEREHPGKVAASFDASSTLAKQIEAGAPADIFISADSDWMDYLAQRRLIRPETRSDLLGNRIVLIAPASSTVKDVAVAPGFDLAGLLAGDRLAVADPSSVPAGKYAKAALSTLGAWDGVASHLAPAQNVRAALLLVARGEAPLGIVYATDAAAEPAIRVVGTFPRESHPPIVYPVAAVAAAKHPLAAAYVAFLHSAAARSLFEKQGFTVLE